MKRIAIILLALLLLVGCAKKEGEKSGAVNDIPVIGGTLSLQMRIPDNINPLLSAKKSVRDVLRIVCEPLIYVKGAYESELCLAESYSFNGDATSLTVNLRRGVLRHDGAQFTADDVLYTLDTIAQNEESAYYTVFNTIASYEKKDSYSVLFNLKRPASQAIYILNFPIVCRCADNTICGTGAYKIESYEPFQSLKLTRNTAWHGAAPYIDGIDVTLTRNDETAADAFSSGRLDAVTDSVIDLDNFAVRSNMRIYSSDAGSYLFIGINHASEVFQSADVRCALSCALERDKIIAAAYSESANMGANLPVPTKSAVFTPQSDSVAYRAQYASELLFSAGWEITTSGKAQKKTDDTVRNLSFSLLVNSDNYRRVKTAEEIVRQMVAAGFDATLCALPWEQYTSRIESGSYDAFLGETRFETPWDFKFLLGSGGKLNVFNYSDSYMDSLLDAIASAPAAPSFTEALREFQDEFLRRQPIVGIAFIGESVVTEERIGGVGAPYLDSPYAAVASWFIRSAKHN